MCRIVQRNTASSRRENKALIKGAKSRSAIRLRLGGGLVGTILEPLQERPERRHLAGLPRPGKKRSVNRGPSAGVSNFVQTPSDNRRMWSRG
jgi:hypothetical protein